MATKLEERPLRMVTAWVEPGLARRLEEAAAQADRSKSAELRVALRAHLERADEQEERGRDLDVRLLKLIGHPR